MKCKCGYQEVGAHVNLMLHISKLHPAFAGWFPYPDSILKSADYLPDFDLAPPMTFKDGV
jgi:hypothetical protein